VSALVLVFALAQAAPPAEVVARVGGRAITAGELEAAAARGLIEPETRAFEVKRRALLEIVDRELLSQEAARRGLAVDALVRAEIEAKAAPVQAWDVDAYLAAHTAELEPLGPGGARAEAERRVREQRIVQRRFGFLSELRARTAVAVALAPPRVAVEPVGAARGPAGAPVTIVEFCEFQCPYCRRVQPTLRQIEARYRDRVRLVFRHYPLARHKDAKKAAEAAECAGDQERFWPMHDRLFGNQGALAVTDLKAHARAIGLDGAAFDACLDSGKHAARWRKDLAEAESYGSPGTPLFFINGRLVSGAQPLAVFAKVIDEELAAGTAGGGAGARP
jgi:protein-disulfide isomerase